MGPASSGVYYFKNLLPSLLLLLPVQLLFASLFTSLEAWDFWTSLYHCFVTATTVGYGDTSPSSQPSRLFSSAHIFVSVVLLAALLNEVTIAVKNRQLQLRKVMELQRKLDPELLTSLDRDGNGIDRNEFVLGMLLELK